jgi:hypothetical protein
MRAKYKAPKYTWRDEAAVMPKGMVRSLVKPSRGNINWHFRDYYLMLLLQIGNRRLFITRLLKSDASKDRNASIEVELDLNIGKRFGYALPASKILTLHSRARDS